MDNEFLAFQDALAGEYSLERELGRGGMGVVHLARDVHLDRLVAIKVLPVAMAEQGEVRERFLREARTAASLAHPNIVGIHRVGEAAGLPYFVMAYVEGQTLGERLRDRGPVPPSTMTQILRDAAQALGYAHSRGTVHRDVKPDNILLDAATGRAMVSDFGIAAAVGQRMDGPVQGTVEFMSPEQLLGEPATGKSDLYALGLVAYLSLSGKLPEAGSPDSIARVARDVPATLAAAIDRCLASDPELRFATGEALLAALDTERPASRSALPTELRAWATNQVPMLPLYGFLSLSGLTTLAFSLAVTGPGVLFPVVSLTVVLMPLVPVTAFQLNKTRRVLSFGYRLADLRFALQTWKAERIAEVDRTAGARTNPWLSIASHIPLGSFIAAVVSAATIVGLEQRSSANELLLVNRGAMALGLASVALLSAFELPTMPLWLERRVIGRARSWLWNGRVGAWLARRLAPKTEGMPIAAFRPTEMALTLAIDDLFALLPAPYSKSLSELPAVARRLATRAAELRAAGERLSRGGDGEAELASAQTANAAQLTETVTALERLRVGLMRLNGGLADLQPVTTALDAARAVDERVSRLVDAQAEVGGGRRLLGFEARHPSPA